MTAGNTSYSLSAQGEANHDLPICTGSNRITHVEPDSQLFEFEMDEDPSDEYERLFPGQSSSFRIKEKTEICKNWLSNTCKFGDRCAFAHGEDEIMLK